MEFGELVSLRSFLSGIKQHQAPSLIKYYKKASGGFAHLLNTSSPAGANADPSDGFSKSSTATCVLSLVATGNWRLEHFESSTDKLIRSIVELPADKWKTKGLPARNPFTTSFLLEAVTVLASRASNDVCKMTQGGRIEEGEEDLDQALADGCVRLDQYPPSAYLTQLAVRVLLRRDALKTDRVQEVNAWSWSEIHRQIALIAADSKSADLFQLVYAIMIATALEDPSKLTPDRNLMLTHALDLFFDGQQDDGSWPRSQPLFHYPGLGSAYCYEYEMLVQLLEHERLFHKLLGYLDRLRLSAEALEASSFRLNGDGLGWSSGHHPQVPGPESWSTASAFHFVHALDRLLAEGIRRALFDEVGRVYSAPRRPKSDYEEFGPDLLDAEIKYGGQPRSLKETIFEHFVEPISRQDDRVAEGGVLNEATAMSAILFGPPGTSKTQLATLIADFLGWPLLSVDPSHFVREGFDRALARASNFFAMLSVTERIVVLVDEIDEMVRERTEAPEMLSRLLTTGMLPQLATISSARRLAFLVATNHIEYFDVAIRRPGRFDIILQVMPPTAKEKKKKWPALLEKLEEFNLTANDVRLDAKIALLTFGECRQVVRKIEQAKTREDVERVIEDAVEGCIMKSTASRDEEDKQTWEQVCESQEIRILVP